MFIRKYIFLHDSKYINDVSRLKYFFHPAGIGGHKFYIKIHIVSTDYGVFVFFKEIMDNRPCLFFHHFVLQKLIRNTVDGNNLIRHLKGRLNVLLNSISHLIIFSYFFHNYCREFNNNICIFLKSSCL